MLGNANLDKHLFIDCDENEEVLSPGMKHRHYAPNTKCILIYSEDNKKLVDKIKELSANYQNPLILSTNENIKEYINFKNVLAVGSQDNLNEISHNIFSTLRKVDSYNSDIVLIQGVTKKGIGLAIMNRLIRACEYNYLDLDKGE